MTIYLIRHATAGKRTKASGDRDRPLDKVGRREAKRLARWLGDRPIDRVLSSEATRCVQTVEPLADERSVGVECHPALLEGASPAATMMLLGHLAGSSTAVLCSHGDVIPEAIAGLRSAGVAIDGLRCAKASVWELTVDGTGIVGGRYLGTPDRQLQT